MNKFDVTLTISLLVLSFLLMTVLYNKEETGTKKALVYYENNLVKTIPFTRAERMEYQLDGALGSLLIVTENGKIKVEKENSPYHLCSKQGWIEKSYQTIVCLPNKVTIQIVAEKEVDTVVR